MQGLLAGSLPQMLRQRQYDTAFEDYLRAQEYPRRNIDMLSRVLSGSPGSTSTTQTPDPSRGSQALGGAALIASLFGKPGGFNFFGG